MTKDVLFKLCFNFQTIFSLCDQGSVHYTLNTECVRTRNFTCTVNEGEIDGYDMGCEPGLTCKATKFSQEVMQYPHLGECVEIEKGIFNKEIQIIHDLHSKILRSHKE